jgi:hypothetical protein
MRPDLGAASAHAQHQVRARVHRRELLDPDVLEDAQHAELPLLVDQRVVGDDREVDLQLMPPGSS